MRLAGILTMIYTTCRPENSLVALFCTSRDGHDLASLVAQREFYFLDYAGMGSLTALLRLGMPEKPHKRDRDR